MSATKFTILIIPALLAALFIFRSSPIIIQLSQSQASQVHPLDLPTCEPDAQGKIDQQIQLNDGSTDSYDWAEVAGCVERPFLDTWGVTHNPTEMAVSPQAQAIVKAIVPPPAGSTHLYRVSYTVHSFVTVSWTLDWLHQLLQGTMNDPQEVLITITKYDGSSFIEHFNGSIRLLKISPQVTLAAARMEVKVPNIDKDKVGELSQQIITRLRVGTPYWEGMTSSQVVDFE